MRRRLWSVQVFDLRSTRLRRTSQVHGPVFILHNDSRRRRYEQEAAGDCNRSLMTEMWSVAARRQRRLKIKKSEGKLCICSASESLETWKRHQSQNLDWLQKKKKIVSSNWVTKLNIYSPFVCLPLDESVCVAWFSLWGQSVEPWRRTRLITLALIITLHLHSGHMRFRVFRHQPITTNYTARVCVGVCVWCHFLTSLWFLFSINWCSCSNFSL